MIKIKVDLSQFKVEMAKNKKNIPKALREIRIGIAEVVERAAKEELYSGHGLIKGDLKRSIRIDPGRNKTTIEPHVVYASWVEFGGLHPRWGVPTSFGGFHYMQKGARKGERLASKVADRIMKKYFRD